MFRVHLGTKMMMVCAGLAFFWTSFLWPGVAAAQFSQSRETRQTEEQSEHPEQEQVVEAKTEENLAEACTAGRVDAKALNSGTQYAVAGFLCGIFGWLFALSSKPKVPADRIIGKSPDYVLLYTDCYQGEARKGNIRSACSGWVLGASVGLLIMTLRDANEASSF